MNDGDGGEALTDGCTNLIVAGAAVTLSLSSRSHAAVRDPTSPVGEGISVSSELAETMDIRRLARLDFGVLRIISNSAQGWFELIA